MNKEFFLNKYDQELTKIMKELPVLEDLKSNYSQQAYVLMIYAHFEGFINRITKDFFNLMATDYKKGSTLNPHYDFCVCLYDKEIYPNKNIWNKFKIVKRMFFKKDNNCLIDTNDNLGYDIFKYLLFIVNISEHKIIDSKFYNKTYEEIKAGKTRKYLSFKDNINELLEKRNDIAHGNSNILKEDFVTQEKIEEISEGITLVLRQFKEDLFDIIENDKHLIT